MSRSVKLYAVALVSLAAAVIVSAFGELRQSQAYHEFCDQRRLLGVANFWNVMSNLVFLVAGIAGLISVRRCGRGGAIYRCLFAGMILTCFGSAYYHFAPDDAKLVYDRLPMTIVFMSLLAAVIAEGIGEVAGNKVLAPLLLLGLGSIAWWVLRGDLRPYVYVQYYPILAVPMILLLFPNAAVRRGWRPLLLAFGWYGLAKIAEALDCPIYSAGHIVSGHTLKHLAAGWSTWLLVKRFRVMYAPPAA